MKDWTEPERAQFLGEKLLVNRATTGTSGLRWDYWEYSNTLKILIGMTGLVLLITCVNVATVLIARSATRAREIGIRLAIGAGRMRVLRQLLTENLFLALIGGVFGLLVAAGAHRALVILLVVQPTRWRVRLPPGCAGPRLQPCPIDRYRTPFRCVTRPARHALGAQASDH